MSLVLNSILLGIVLGVAGVFVAFSMPGVPIAAHGMRVAGVLVSIMSLVGWHMFSRPDPSFVGKRTGADARVVVRAANIALAVIATLQAGLSFAAPPALTRPAANALGGTFWAAVALFGLSMIAFCVLFFAAMRYVRWLAPRIPDRTIYNRANRNMWLVPIIFVVGAPVFYLGPLLALIMFWNLLDLVRKRLKLIGEDRKAMALASGAAR
ncbi:MAG: hypothetical protein R3B68_15205 [Phycisphaerales bacterium]